MGALARRLAAGPVVAVLLDMDLGDGATGPDAARAVRDAHPSAHIAFLTADSRAELAARAAAFGPVFSKSADGERVIAWLIALAETAPRRGVAG
jgi:DNA-binding NarL/FixJ family response regulator